MQLIGVVCFSIFESDFNVQQRIVNSPIFYAVSESNELVKPGENIDWHFKPFTWGKFSFS